MQDGEEMCLARAVAHERTKAPKFSDPTAAGFLSEETKASFLRLRAGATEPSEQVMQYLVQLRSEVIAARTIALDEAIRGAEAMELVNLGAGPCGRAAADGEMTRTCRRYGSGKASCPT